MESLKAEVCHLKLEVGEEKEKATRSRKKSDEEISLLRGRVKELEEAVGSFGCCE